ncbi:MAG: siphovirus Gp157 family protein [Megamonas funiformis]|nr:siphovirus Gp157 family protein [Megamonas funiformis]
MMNLYEIKQEFEKAIEECVDMETGEIINPTRLDELNMVLTDKRENVALYIKNLSAEAKAIDEEAKNLTNRKRVLNNKVEGLKKYLADNLEGHKFETAKVVVSFRKSEQLEINSIEHIPTEYLISQEPKIDKVALKKSIKQGAVINGVQIITKQNIQIK